MKATKIKLSASTDIDLPKLIDSRLLVQANSGGGKSWILRRILEQSHGKVQQIVIDPEGEFSTLREKYDYVLAGKGGDTPATPQSAAMLAHKLLEMNVSAIVDLYELPPAERKRFVRLFLDSMVNAPKELWHPVIVVVDEAHVFCPEKGQAESSDAVIDLATRGRKRGYCVVLATQRLSKLHKDAAAECNNKLIGRTGLDIDMKRAAEELGFTSKEQYLSLRALDPGDFYAFGPALTKQVERVKVGTVTTTHPKAGSRSLTKTVPPTAAIKKVLGKLADLPAEARKEAATMAELKTEVATLTRENRQLKATPPAAKTDPAAIQKIVGKALLDREREYDKERSEFIRQTGNFLKVLEDIGRMIAPILKDEKLRTLLAKKMPIRPSVEVRQPIRPVAEARQPIRGIRPDYIVHDEVADTGNLGKINTGERKVLKAVAGDPDGITRDHLTVLVGYKATSRNEYIRRLKMRGFVDVQGDRIIATQEGIDELGHDFEQLPTGQELQDHHLRTLPEGERKILAYLLDQGDREVDREEISEATNYKATSRNEYIRRLVARKLVVPIGKGLVKVSDKLY